MKVYFFWLLYLVKTHSFTKAQGSARVTIPESDLGIIRLLAPIEHSYFDSTQSGIYFLFTFIFNQFRICLNLELSLDSAPFCNFFLVFSYHFSVKKKGKKKRKQEKTSKKGNLVSQWNPFGIVRSVVFYSCFFFVLF